jgi:glycosyltransferase involved in cell wall biosynthesis
LDTNTVHLKITGRSNGVVLNELSLSDGVEFTGYLDDIRPTVGSSWVCVVPLREGGGTRLKILEAMALGTPVVSTSKGAEGLEVTHGENILVADDPAEFARHTLAVLKDQQLRSRLSANARRLVETKYDWNMSGAKFEALLSELVERRRA